MYSVMCHVMIIFYWIKKRFTLNVSDQISVWVSSWLSRYQAEVEAVSGQLGLNLWRKSVSASPVNTHNTTEKTIREFRRDPRAALWVSSLPQTSISVSKLSVKRNVRQSRRLEQSLRCVPSYQIRRSYIAVFHHARLLIFESCYTLM